MAVSELNVPAAAAARRATPPAPFEPYIAGDTIIRELTPLPLLIGTLLGVIFGASSLYLVLKVGLTVSASIPVAVISITFFRVLSKLGGRDATILENNIVQTAGSAGESIAFGLGVTMPAIMILGFDLEATRTILVAVLGGLLGILMMIPLRRALIVQQHGVLKYPEGTACAEVLKAGASVESQALASPSAKAERAALGGATTSAATIFTGFGVGFLYKAANVAFKGWKDVPEKIFGAPFAGASISAEISPELLGVGYIIGPYIASIMCAGGVLAYLVLIPAIKFFGSAASVPIPPGTVPVSEMTPDAIRNAYVLYIGAGAVAAGGIFSLARSLPTIWASLLEALKDFRGGAAARASLVRTDRDLSSKFVFAGSLVLIGAIMLARPLHMNLLGACLLVVLGFLFVTVSARLTGEIGSSSNPISGMTVATLLLTCLAFLLVGWTGPSYYVTALSVGAIVCIASSNGGTTSQDLKTGFLVGATPGSQQIAILVGSLVAALVLGPILLRLNDSATVFVPRVSQQPITTERGPSFRAVENFPATMHVDPATLSVKETHAGTEYLVWYNQSTAAGPEGKYLVDASGAPVFLVDPGINGVHRVTPDGQRQITKFDAPKATLMSYIIKGILNRQLPWGLVLLGVMIAVTLEMSGVPSLAFAVGVYLPLSSSSPIFLGGMIRWLGDRYVRRKHRGRQLTAEQLTAEGDKSPGVLLASGYIAGGAIAGILIAFMAGAMADLTGRLTEWSSANNPFYEGASADVLSLIPFALLIGLLHLVGREVIFRPAVEAGSRPDRA
jgi:putative OPT family oligopeptide transporter